MLKAWAVVLAFTTIALAGCAGTEKVQDFGTVEAPDIHAGHAYAYDIMGAVALEISGAVDGEAIPAEHTDVDIPRTPLSVMQVLNASFGPNGSYYLAAQRFMDAPAGAIFGTGNDIFGMEPVAIRKSDLAPFAVTSRQAQECNPGCRLTTTSMEISGETPLDPYLDFPLSAGKTWQNRVIIGFDLNDEDLEAIIDSRVLGKESVAFGNDTVDAIHIKHTIRLPAHNAFQDAVVAEMEAEGAQDVQVALTLKGTMDTYYAESLRNVVLETTSSSVVADITFMVEGHAVAMHVGATSELDLILTGAILDEDPALDMAGIYTFFDTAQPLKQPGQATETGAYTLQVTADKAEFNVADDETVAFTVAADPALPAGDTVRYTISDSAGGVVDSGVGTTFELAFEDAGLYQVVVQAVSQAGIVQAIDSMVVAADYTETVAFTCGNVIVAAVPGSGSCTSVAIPIFTSAGLEGVTITINADNKLAYGGTFRITDDAGTMVEKTASDGDAFTLADLATLAIDGESWSANWDRDLALLEAASVTISLDYGPETAPAAEDPPIMLRAVQGMMSHVFTQISQIPVLG